MQDYRNKSIITNKYIVYYKWFYANYLHTRDTYAGQNETHTKVMKSSYMK